MTAKHGRRLFLRGLGGAVVVAPFLGSVAERIAKGQGAPAPTPRRLIVMWTHYGCLTDRWFPVNSHGPLTAADFTGTSLEALAPHVDKLLMPRGIRAMNEWTDDLSLGQGNDPMTQVCGSYFTCVPVTPHSDDPFDFTEETKFLAKPTAPSLDHVCAKQLTSDGIPLFMRVSGLNDNTQSAISYSASEQAFPGLGDPRQVFSALTGLFTDAEPVSPDSYQAVRGQSVIDLVKDDLETLERYDMSASDKRKLAAWKELLHETGGVVASAQCNTSLLATLGLTEENLLAYEDPEADRVSSRINGDMDGADLFSNLAVLSALCDPTRPIFLKYPPNYVFSGLGLSNESQSISVRLPGALVEGCVEDVNEMILTIDRYYAQKFAYLVRQLDGIDEGDGTLLDSSAAVWFQQYSDGSARNLNNLPILQAGSCGGYFKTGQAINVDGGAADLSRGNSEAVCVEGGGGIDSMKGSGTPVEFANAPINKYYCNLMNAIGVKAGPDGFPAVGGQEPVTHFGMYDDTRDFVSGGENPPSINDPGEFTELRGSS